MNVERSGPSWKEEREWDTKVVSRAVARVLRHEDVNKIWYTQEEANTRFKET